MLKQHVLDQLRQFVKTITDYRSHQKSLTKPALIKVSLSLLEELPASREIVFEYFALLAEIAVQSYVTTANVDPQTGLPSQQGRNQQQQQRPQEDDCFSAVQTALQNLVVKGPSAWCPIIASWSLDLAGSLSEKYTQRRMTIGAACNFWLNCNTIRGILTLINLCFRKLTNAEAEICVESLLAAFNRYPKSFDWVVARLGGCFPQKIIAQILQCGVKRFSDNYRCHLESEVGILEYLSLGHEHEHKMALREMLQDGFNPKKPIDISIIPFLMVISSYSDTVLQNLVTVFLEMYNDELLNVIIQKAPLWMNNKLFAEMQPSLNNMILRLKQHGADLLISVAKMAEQYVWCQDFLEYSLLELEQIVLNARLCPLLTDLAEEDTKHLLWRSCLSANLIEQQTAVRLLLIVSTQHPHIYHQTISDLLRKSYKSNPNGIGSLVRILGGQSGVVEFPDIMPGLKMVLEDVMLQEQVQSSRLPLAAGETSEAYNTIQNLNMLTKMQKKNLFPNIKPQLLTNAVNECLPKLLQIFEVTVTKLLLRIDADADRRNDEKFKKQTNNNNSYSIQDLYGPSDPKKHKLVDDDKQTNSSWIEADQDFQRLRLSHIIVDLFNTIEAAAKGSVLRTTEVLKLAVLSVKYFFIALTEQSVIRRAAAAHRVCSLLQRQCSTRKTARTACLRELIEGALFYHGYLFGQYEEPETDELEIPESEMVSQQNQGNNMGGNSNRSVLHSGVIGRGLRTEFLPSGEDCDSEMQSLFLKALNACCADIDKPNNVDGYSLVSLMLVELVSTDVMYNGLPFPDEEFTKVTMERDLMIRRGFITSPILWAIMGLISTHRPALCFSSVLLRALCATCLQQWRAKNVNKFQTINPKEELMQCTKKLLQLLSMSQLIPPPLSTLHMIIEHFEAPEIALLLKECIWNYLKDHVPSPALFQIDANGLHWRNHSLSRVPAQYVDPLRHLMQRKLTKLGPYYHQMFIMCELNEPADNDNNTNVIHAGGNAKVVQTPLEVMEIDN